MHITYPNLLTLLRLGLALPIALLLSIEDAWAVWSGAGLFAVAALTDSADGWIARRYGQSTLEGAFLDPLADKLVVLAVLGALLWWRVAPGWMVAILLLRDVATTLLRWYSLRRGEPVRTLPSARVKTFVQMLGLVFLVVLLALWRSGAAPHAQWAQELLFGWVAWSLLLGMTLLALWTLGLYGWRYRALWLRRLPVE
jgi:CDP-diacylglycerol--glycerol-3-phosphate 3-phosphatidyltransferase